MTQDVNIEEMIANLCDMNSQESKNHVTADQDERSSRDLIRRAGYELSRTRVEDLTPESLLAFINSRCRLEHDVRKPR
jgi:hypothetical protein